MWNEDLGVEVNGRCVGCGRVVFEWRCNGSLVLGVVDSVSHLDAIWGAGVLRRERVSGWRLEVKFRYFEGCDAGVRVARRARRVSCVNIGSIFV